MAKRHTRAAVALVAVAVACVLVSGPAAAGPLGQPTTDAPDRIEHFEGAAEATPDQHSQSATDRAADAAGPASTNVSASTSLRSTVDLDVEQALSGDSDSDRVTFSFRVSGSSNMSTRVSVTPSQTTRSYGDVEFEFVEWSDQSGGGSGTSSSWTATGGHTYQVTYEVSANNGATEGSYSITATASSGLGDQHTERIVADVEVREPEFEQPSGTTEDIRFDESTGDRANTETQVEIGNGGDGVMVIDSVSVGATPRGIDASVANEPDRIGANGRDGIDLDISVDDTVEEGDHSFTVTASDNLGNRETYEVTVRVEKVPVLSADSTVISLGEVLVGESTVKSFTLREAAGYESVSDVVTEFAERDSRGNLAFGGLGETTISAGESTSQSVTVQVDEDVEQGSQLRWEVSFAPQDNRDGNARVVFTAQVIYPPYYDGVSVGGADFVFDRPRSEVTSYTETTTMQVRNGGDLPMNIESVSPSVDAPGIDATVVDRPDTIPARSSRTFGVRIEAQPEASEGEHTLSMDVQAAEPGSTTVSSTVTVDRQADLAVDPGNLSVGEVIVTERASTATVLSEQLGYESVRDFGFEQVSGPDRGWITVVERPSTIAAGESGEVVLAVSFDPSATLYRTYNWTFAASGTNVETERFTVSAVPRPIDFSQVRDDLTALEGEVEAGDGMVTEMDGVLGTLEEKLRAGNAPRSDIVAVSTAGRSTTLFLQSAEQARTALDAGNHSAAQLHLTRTAAAYRTLGTYTDRISNDELAQRAAGVTERADEILAALTDRQLSYYRGRLEAENTTMLERARIERDLSRLAALRGDSDRAGELRTEADRAFSNYSTLVAEGNERLEAGRSQRDDLDESLFVSALGQRVFWIGSLDRFESATRATLSEYDTAEQRFRAAGAVERADSAAAERASLAAAYDGARTVSLGIGAGLGLVFLVVVVLESRALYRYIQESRAAVSGDFLV
ncbi:hypothetical protein HZS55_04265 [Halosimplex rubrum]|uniref:Uncharacterized protein n=1 Tax=Halosimplex rubrum TaxID=869889 RepID=A0A7D5NYN8_9EURY|nr:hypothetical protein [Halosimplex rubrum]QLH76566.1 hypothetical protein HZS55_04265 [Halosimplex rubrum]